MANYVLHIRGNRILYLNESEFKKNIENNFNYSILGQINKNIHVEIEGKGRYRNAKIYS